MVELVGQTSHVRKHSILGYSKIKSKPTVRTQAGRKIHTGTQADFVAFQTTDRLPTLVVDAKSPKEGISRADLPQVQSYAISPDIKPRAKFVMLTSGYATQIYPVDSEDPVFTSDLLSLFDKIKEIKEILTGKTESFLKLNQIDIDNFFRNTHDLMYSQDTIKPTPALIIMTKLMLIKMQEEKGQNISRLGDVLDQKEKYLDSTTSLEEKKRIEESIRSYINDLLKNVSTDLLPKDDRTIGTHISMPVLFEIVEGLSKHHIGSVKADVQGRAFEVYLGKTMKGKELGQYFTPRQIVDFMVDIVNPTRQDMVIDPACGTGGFLKQTFLKISDHLEKERIVLGKDEYAKKRNFLHKDQIYGTDKDPLGVQLSMINMFMWGDSHSHIHRHDGLIDMQDGSEIVENKFSVILTNPPFGSASDVKIKANKIPLNYDLGKKWKFNEKENFYEKTAIKQSQDAGILFLERCVKLATANGKIAIVLPSGVFNNKTNEYVRQWIQQNIDIKLVVSLPILTFKLTDANNFTSILFGKRKPVPNNHVSKYAVSIAKNIGFDDKGNTIDKNGNLIPTDLNKIKYLFFEKIGWED